MEALGLDPETQFPVCPFRLSINLAVSPVCHISSKISAGLVRQKQEASS